MSDDDRPTRREVLRACLGLGLTGLSPLVLGASCRGKKGPAPSKSHRQPSGEEPWVPSYVALHESGELRKRGEALWKVMESCTLCPRECEIDRTSGIEGECQASSTLEIASYHPHFGEEDPLVGTGGSGTIFLTNCSLRCVFCINWDISQEGAGEPRSVAEMAEMMIALQQEGCHNVNVVTPTHYAPHILLALDEAAARGLRVPLVWNTCGWEKPETLETLDGVVDIYLPDFKYWDGEMAFRYSSAARSYPDVAKEALLEMHRQVGVASPGPDGVMRRGLMVRHLVMPGDVSGSVDVVRWIAENLPKNTYLNIMSQYRPMFRASEYPEIDRPVTKAEYEAVVTAAREAGLTNLDIQGHV